MEKRFSHHLWTKIRPVKVWYLLALFLFAATMSVMALRDNNLKMVQLRDDVYKADELNTDVEGALQRLRKHVYSHMNSDLSTGNNVYPPIQLKFTYQRLVTAEKERVKQVTAATYTDAQKYCEQQNPSGFSGRGRVPCIEDYVKNHGATERQIPDAMYKFDFVSPRWSPDIAGFSLVVSILLFILLALRIVAGRVLKAWSSK
jgi:hypothetical protein